METLVSRLQSAPGWNEELADELLDSFRGAKADGSLPQEVSTLATAVATGDASGPLRFAFNLANALTTEEAAPVERVAATLEYLNQQGEWKVLGRLAIGIADISGDPSFCRYVARAGEEGGLSVLPAGTLDRALELAPDNHRLTWLKGQRLEEAGDPAALGFFAASIIGWAHAKQVDKVEEAILRIVETPNRDHWLLAWEGVTFLARQGDPKPLNSFLEIGIDQLGKLDLLETVWDSLRRLLESDRSTRKIRSFAVTVAEKLNTKLASIGKIIERSGLSDPDVAPAKALKEYDRLLRFAPGLLVIHQAFGVGKIVDNDGEMVVIDFPDKAAHRMSLPIAERSLDILPPDDLKTAILTDLERLKSLAKDDPVGLLAMALKKTGGEGGSTEVRKLLVPDVVSANAWAAWWKRASAAAGSDERIDTSQVFRKLFRLVSHHANGALLPPIQEKSDLHQNVENVRRFLLQHPGSEQEARRAYRPRLLQWLGSSSKPEARAHLLNVLRLWDPRLEPDFRESVKEVLDAGGDFLFTSIESEQLDFLSAGEAAGEATWAAIASLPSRYDAVRERAAAMLNADPRLELTRFTRELYSRSPNNASRILGLVDFALQYPGVLPVALGDPWLALRAVIAIVHGAPKEPLRRWALALVKPTGPFAAQLREHPIDDEGRMLLEQQLIQWRTTDRHLFPVLEFLEVAGGAEVVAEVQRYRSERSAELVAKSRAASEADSGSLMTRAGLERLRDEIIDIETTLKTTLPETIRRAMALGDLKENAEYHAAKEKQRQLGERITRLRELIGQAKAIEDLTIEEGVAGPGTEVATRDLVTGHEESFWILGEGDSFHGPHVITYSAPLGMALRGKRAGDVLTAAVHGVEHRLEILSVRKKLPA